MYEYVRIHTRRATLDTRGARRERSARLATHTATPDPIPQATLTHRRAGGGGDRMAVMRESGAG